MKPIGDGSRVATADAVAQGGTSSPSEPLAAQRLGEPVLPEQSSARRRTPAGSARSAASDAVIAAALALVSSALVPVGLLGGHVGAPDALALAALFGAVAPVTNVLAGSYGWRGPNRTPFDFARLAGAAMGSAWAVLVAGAALGLAPDLATVAITGVALPLAWGAGRAVTASLVAAEPERVLVVGSGRVADRIDALSSRHAHRAFDVVGFVDDEPRRPAVSQAPCLGTIDDLPQLLDRQATDRVLVAFSARRDEDVVRVLRECDAHGVDVDVVPRLFDLLGPSPRAYALGGFPVLSVSAARESALGGVAKRALDIAAATVGLLTVAPLLALLALLVVLDSGRPVFYRQERVGRGGRLFRMVKFRTLECDAQAWGDARIAEVEERKLPISEAVDALKKEVSRPTRAGRWLRASSLDELPQLWNVLVGDMSLVGPRPLRPFEVATLDGWQRRRQSVRPGMTGLWQVLGRSEVPWDERMELDYSYVRHWSLAHDLRILARTYAAVMSRRGAL